MRGHLFIQQTVTVHTVDRVCTQSTSINERFDCFNQIKPFVLEIVCGGGRKHQERWSSMTIGNQRHLRAEIRTKPGGSATFHRGTFLNLNLEPCSLCFVFGALRADHKEHWERRLD